MVLRGFAVGLADFRQAFISMDCNRRLDSLSSCTHMHVDNNNFSLIPPVCFLFFKRSDSNNQGTMRDHSIFLKNECKQSCQTFAVAEKS